MAETETKAAKESAPGEQAGRATFPDPSYTIVEFGEALGLLLAERTERDVANRRLVLKKVAYIRILEKGWGGAAYPEIWIEQTKEGVFFAVEPKSGKVLRHPSKRRYEVSFITRDIFECAVTCLKEHQPGPIYELALVTFGAREGFSVEDESLLAPDDYASIRDAGPGKDWLPAPPLFNDKK